MDLASLVDFFFTADGPGGIFAMSILILALVIYYALTRWILRGGKE
jgi:hypothetical protein